MTGIPVDAGLDRQLRRRGAITMSIFALIWSMAGSSGFEDTAVRFTVLGVGVAISVAMIVLAIRVENRTVPERTRQLPQGWERTYNIVGFVQVIAIVIAVVALVRLDQAALIPAVVCLIVGLHFFPLVGTFDQPLYQWTGLGLCAVAVVGAVSLVGLDEAPARALVGIAAAVVLWLTSARLTFRG